MSHFKLIVSVGLTCLLAVAANTLIASYLGYNLYALKFWLVAPVGAALIGFVGASGAVLAARYFNAKPKWSDAIPLLTLAVATVVLIYALDETLALDDRYKANKLIDFRSYLDLVFTKLSANDGDKIREGEYYLAAIEFVGLILGGALSLSLIGEAPRCVLCAARVRKLKSTTTPPLTFNETTGVLDLFETSDLEDVQKLVEWRPEEKTFAPKSERAIVTYDLYICPNCRAEEIIASVKAFRGKKWKDVPSLSARRVFTTDLSLPDAFH